jgi:hypothetical protein
LLGHSFDEFVWKRLLMSLDEYQLRNMLAHLIQFSHHHHALFRIFFSPIHARTMPIMIISTWSSSSNFLYPLFLSDHKLSPIRWLQLLKMITKWFINCLVIALWCALSSNKIRIDHESICMKVEKSHDYKCKAKHRRV